MPMCAMGGISEGVLNKTLHPHTKIANVAAEIPIYSRPPSQFFFSERTSNRRVGVLRYLPGSKPRVCWVGISCVFDFKAVFSAGDLRSLPPSRSRWVSKRWTLRSCNQRGQTEGGWCHG